MRTNSLLGNFEDIEASMDPRKDIEQFINDNYNISYNISDRFRISKEPNKDGKYEVDGWGVVRVIHLTTSTLTNGMFEWREIYGSFSCDHCIFLTSLEGAPKKCRGGFYCHNCISLTSLEGSPKKVSGSFNCSNCDSLKTLEGCPEEVGGSFNCFDCKSLILTADIPKNIHEKIIRYYSGNVLF